MAGKTAEFVITDEIAVINPRRKVLATLGDKQRILSWSELGFLYIGQKNVHTITRIFNELNEGDSVWTDSLGNDVALKWADDGEPEPEPVANPIEAERIQAFADSMPKPKLPLYQYCARLSCVKPFSFRVPGQRGRAITVKVGDSFWNTSPTYIQERDGTTKIARKGKKSADAYEFPLSAVSEYFEVVA